MKAKPRDVAVAWKKIRGLLPSDTNTQAIVTLLLPSVAHTTRVSTDAGGAPDIEHPRAIIEAFQLIAFGPAVVIVVRSVDDDTSHVGPTGLPVPFKTVRAWLFENGIGKPVDAEQLRLSYLTDAFTGEPREPEPDVRYAQAWSLTCKPNGA